MRDKDGYWYKNETLINRLGITKSEQKHMKTIIGLDEKYDRNNERRRVERRNENGLTKREQEKINRLQKIKDLKDKGMNQSKIAKALGISRQAVSKLIRELRD